MLLVSHTATLRGGMREPIAWATGLAELVNSLVEPEISLYLASAGAPVGTVTFSGVNESRADLDDAMGAVSASDAYHESLEAGDVFLAAPVDVYYRELVYPVAPSGNSYGVGSVVTQTTATIANGKFAEAMTFGAKIAGLVTDATGTPAAFFRDLYGTWGQVTWLQVCADMAGVDAADKTLLSNADYLAAIDAAADLFIPGSGHQALATRIA